MDGESENCCPSSGKDENMELRSGKAQQDIGGKEVSTEKLMRPQSGDSGDGDF